MAVVIYGDNRDRLRGEWSAGDWAALDALLRLDGYRVRHCAHCDRYDDESPDQHPSCLIVPWDPPWLGQWGGR